MDYIIWKRKLQRTTTLWILGSFIDYLKDNGGLVNAASGLLLIPSVPFALAPFLQENFSNIEIYKDLKKQNKNIRNQIINKER